MATSVQVAAIDATLAARAFPTLRISPDHRAVGGLIECVFPARACPTCSRRAHASSQPRDKRPTTESNKTDGDKRPTTESNKRKTSVQRPSKIIQSSSERKAQEHKHQSRKFKKCHSHMEFSALENALPFQEGK